MGTSVDTDFCFIARSLYDKFSNYKSCAFKSGWDIKRRITDNNETNKKTDKNITTYFRKTFDVANAANSSALSMRLLRDDGAVVYVNGVELERPNMPAGEITSEALATSAIFGSAEREFTDYVIDPGPGFDLQRER